MIKTISNLNINKIHIDGTMSNGIKINIDPDFEENTIIYENENDINSITITNDDLYLNSSRIRSKSFIINLKSASHILLKGVCNIEGDIKAFDITLTNNGVGDIKFSGRLSRLTANLKGTGDINIKELFTDYANLNLTGVGDIIAYVNQNGNFVNTGTGDMTVYGEPEYQKICNGLGSIKFKTGKQAEPSRAFLNALTKDKKTKSDYNDYYNQHIIDQKKLQEYKNDLNDSFYSQNSNVDNSEIKQKNALKDVVKQSTESPETRLKNKIKKIL